MSITQEILYFFSIRRDAKANRNLDNRFFKHVLETALDDWEYTLTENLPSPKVKIPASPGTNKALYKKKNNPEMLMYSVDLFFRIDPELLAITQEFASDNKKFLMELKYAWTKLANMDRYVYP